MSSPELCLEVPAKVVGGTAVRIVGAWDFHGLPDRKRIAIYEKYPTHYLIWGMSTAVDEPPIADVGVIAFDWNVNPTDADVSTHLLGVLQNTKYENIVTKRIATTVLAEAETPNRGISVLLGIVIIVLYYILNR